MESKLENWTSDINWTEKLNIDYDLLNNLKWDLIDSEKNIYSCDLGTNKYKIFIEHNDKKCKVKLLINGKPELKDYFNTFDLKTSKEGAICMVLHFLNVKYNYWKESKIFLENKINRINRISEIKNFIDSRKNDNQEPMPCLFYFTTPQLYLYKEIKDDEYIKEIKKILKKYNIEHRWVDTVPGEYCLNRDWLEAKGIPCYIEYCGVYPTNWDIEDVARLEELNYSGKLMVRVVWNPRKDEYIDNN